MIASTFSKTVPSKNNALLPYIFNKMGEMDIFSGHL